MAGATTQFAFGLLNGNLAVAVANLVKNLRGEVLAKPQITTIDNTEARIFMGEQVPIRVLDANGRQAIQLQDAGTSLHGDAPRDRRRSHPARPESREEFLPRGDPSAGTILQKQSAKTTVVVNDGETVVIAGLTTKEETDTETGVALAQGHPHDRLSVQAHGQPDPQARSDHLRDPAYRGSGLRSGDMARNDVQDRT